MSPSDRWISALVHAHREALFRYLARYTGDPDLAEDLVQETFIRLRDRPPHDRAEPARWLFTVATNLARDHRRVAHRREELARAGSGRLPMADPPPDPPVEAEGHDRRDRVRAALATLSDRDRTALLMREEGFTHREIAAVVEATPKSIGTILVRALDKLSRALTPEVP